MRGLTLKYETSFDEDRPNSPVEQYLANEIMLEIMQHMVSTGQRDASEYKELRKKLEPVQANLLQEHVDDGPPAGMKGIGFWRYAESYPTSLPWPVPASEEFSRKAEFLNRLDAFEASAEKVAYRGSSKCRICGCWNGSKEFRYRGWAWPEGYRHYIEVHNVSPDPEFETAVYVG